MRRTMEVHINPISISTPFIINGIKFNSNPLGGGTFVVFLHFFFCFSFKGK